MSIYKNTLLEDLNRIRTNISIYRQRIFEYPQGSLMTRNINGRDYIYLKYRKDRKVIQEYVSPFSQNIYNELKSKIDQRKILQNELKSLIAEERDMVKALKALGEKNV